MVSKEQKKIERVINFMKKGLTSLSDDLEETVKGINDFVKSLNKALKDLKEVSIEEEVQTVSTSSQLVAAPTGSTAKTAAASTLFNLLSGGASAQPVTATSPIALAPAAPVTPSPGVPPKRSGASGPPKAPSSAGVSGPPKAPTGSAPARTTLPPAPKLPPTSGEAPSPASTTGVSQPPTFVKRPGPPAASVAASSVGTTPPRPPGAPVSSPGPAVSMSAAPKPGGGLSSLRDEMLEELNRLKKIMRGE